jgi:DNA-binding CsgD family transcriptional regulator
MGAMTVRDRIIAGRDALAGARWDEARARFEEALAEEDAAEAWEGLSWAAWWADDGATVFAARARAYRLYRRRGDPAGAARMATWLAADELDFNGAWAIAGGWLARARRLLQPLEPGPDHGWLAFHEGYLAHAAGDTQAARAQGAHAAELGRRFGVADLEMLGLALQGAALVAAARTDEGMRLLDEATATALEGEAAIPISGAWACCMLVSACIAVLDYARAAQWCDRIGAFAGRYGSRYMLAFCRAEYGAVDVWRGRWADASDQLAAAVDDFGRSRPAWAGGPLAALAELRRRQGRADEAGALLERAGGSQAAVLCRARLALDAGRPDRAADLVERHLRQVPADRALQRAPALELLVRARLVAGELDAAADALSAFAGVARAVGTAPLCAHADLLDGLLAAARGDHERARPRIEDALDRFVAAGAPFEAALARSELATTLAALGMDDAAREEAGAAEAALRTLGAAVDADRAARLVARLAGAPTGAAMPGITAREGEVLALVAAGLTNRQIAERLTVSPHTVHRHVANILRKLGLPSRTAAAAHAARAGRAEE